MEVTIQEQRRSASRLRRENNESSSRSDAASPRLGKKTES